MKLLKLWGMDRDGNIAEVAPKDDEVPSFGPVGTVSYFPDGVVYLFNGFSGPLFLYYATSKREAAKKLEGYKSPK